MVGHGRVYRNRGQTDASSGIYLPWRDVILISIDALILVVVYLAIAVRFVLAMEHHLGLLLIRTNSVL